MSSRRTLPACGPVRIACCLMALCAAFLLPFARSAKASLYPMVWCAVNNGVYGLTTETNTISSGNPEGIIIFQNQCSGGSPSYPAGGGDFLRLVENQESGYAGYGAYGRMSFGVPGFVHIAAAGGYTREPSAFNEGWRGRFWAERFDGSTQDILVQGSGVSNGSCGGVCWATTSSFAPHLWPFGGYGDYRRFAFELGCVRQLGCNRAGFNAVDANSLQFVLNDVAPPTVSIPGTVSGIQSGNWVRGSQPVSWSVSDLGSGLRWERLRVDGGQRYVLDHRSECDLGWNGATGEFARQWQPCPTGGPFWHSATLDTATIPDGSHTLQVCAQDYGQAIGLSGTGGETCDQRNIKTDNTAPAAPGGLTILTPSPGRYLDHFGVQWTLAPDPGSPIAKVHYEVLDPNGTVVVPEKTVAATNPTELEEVEGPKDPGAYELRVWLEDSVGFLGPAASVPIPHDTTPPDAPQEISVTAPSTARSADGFDVRWHNITDDGSPIRVAHYQVVDEAGNVVVATTDLEGDDPQSIEDLAAPQQPGDYTLKVWLSDTEGNIGAPATAPLSYHCIRSDVGGGSKLSAGLGESSERVLTVAQGHGSTFDGELDGPDGPVAGAALCVFSNVVTDSGREFLGIATTGKDGRYSFAIPPGASREIASLYRPGHRELEARARIQTRVKPTFAVRKRVVRNKHAEVFSGEIPGPHNDKVVVVLQVKSGKGWRAFRRYRTRSNGGFKVRYRFTRTRTPTVYIMRAQVRETTGYPYLQGNSRALKLRVMP